jgi:two-component system phosphate regulon sensor histidine kinase PhoR
MRSIQFRLILTYLALIVVSTAITFTFFLPKIQLYLEQRAEEHVRAESQVLGNLLSSNYEYFDANLALVADDLKKNFSRVVGMRIRLYDPDGTLVADSTSEALDGQPLNAQAQQAVNGTQVTWTEQVGTERILHTTTPLSSSRRVFGVVDISTPTRDNETIAAVRHLMEVAAVVSGLVSWLVAFLLAQTIVRPLRRIRTAADAIAHGNLATRVSAGGGDELAQLGGAINEMAAQLESRISEILREKDKMNRLLETLIDGVITLDHERRIGFMNPVAEKLLGTPASHAGGRALDEVFDNPNVLGMLDECVASGRLVTKDIHKGSSILQIFVFPYEGGHIVLTHDITDLRRLEEARAQFLSAVSHELRTPLTIIKGFVITILDNDTVKEDAELQRSLELIDQETDRLSRLVDEVLELSRMRSKKLTLDLALSDGEEAVADVYDIMNAHAERVGVRLRRELSMRHEHILADRDRFRQILVNLVDNAIKYTPSGGEVVLRTRSTEREWIVEIGDNGRGVPPEEIPFMFERFFRGKDNRKGDAAAGTGLGLAIVRELVDMHGGRIEVDSRVGEGTTVRLLFPKKEAAGAAESSRGMVSFP